MSDQSSTPSGPRTPRPPENFGMLPYGVSAPPPEEAEPVDEGPPRRPGVVTAASVVTWVFAGIALLVAAWMLIAVNADRSGFERSVERQNDLDGMGLTASELARIFTISGTVLVLLSVLAVVLALGVYRGSNVARILLIILSLVTCVASLMVAFALLPLAWLIAGMAVLSLLMLGRTKWWTHLSR
jgi:hypothetical protein